MLKRMNEALDYIEKHLTDEIDFKEIEKVTGTSILSFSPDVFISRRDDTGGIYSK